MLDKLKSIISKVDANYSDIRYETKKETKIIFNGEELNQIGSNITDGYVIRILKNGGLSSIAFTKEVDAEKAISNALENATLIARNVEKPIELAKTEVIKDTFLPELKEDPRMISIDEKLEITQKYNGIPLKHNGISTTTTQYLEVIREKYYVNNEGSEIREDLITTRIFGTIISKDGNLIQNVRAGVGGSNGFALLRDKEEEFEKKTNIVLDLLKANPVKGGVYNVILNPSIAGVFTHEAFGHFSEADLIEDSPTMREKMQLGAKLGSDALNIIDDPTTPDQLGFYKYDDEGVKARSTKLLEYGVLVGRLHSRRTAASFEEHLTGHCVAEDYRFAPIIRMGNIFIQPGRKTFEELLAELDDGLYILDSKGGQTSGENFTFGAQYAYIVKDGKLGKMIRDINISGNLYKTLQNITLIGNDLDLCKIGGCGKGQLNIRSCHGAPHIIIKDVIIGGM
ncbi:TldD/PmbA family protein [candidate division WOR-3 bacterium]|nr:TldD/PmbA family protein [candidate division WOR-3 bacterium]